MHAMQINSRLLTEDKMTVAAHISEGFKGKEKNVENSTKKKKRKRHSIYTTHKLIPILIPIPIPIMILIPIPI